MHMRNMYIFIISIIIADANISFPLYGNFYVRIIAQAKGFVNRFF